MKPLKILLFLSLLIFSCESAAPNADDLDDSTEQGETGQDDDSSDPMEEARLQMLLNKPIRDLVALQPYVDNIIVGSANHQRNLESYDSDETCKLSIDILKREYSYVTPANDFKQPYIHSTLDEDDWQWDKCYQWLEYAQENDVILRLHAPISPQCSTWVAEDDRTAEELEQMLTEYMTALCKEFNGVECIKWLDVVNETIATKTITDDVFADVDAGDWFGPREGTDKWQNPWVTIGSDTDEKQVPLYIDMAFEIANQYAPDIKQIINQHGDFEEVVWNDTMKYLVEYLEAKGRRIDGIGWQAHIDSGWEEVEGNLERLASFIDWCHAKGLAFHITEMNVYIDGEPTDESLEAQANTFAAITNTMFTRQANGVVGINFWHTLDIDSSSGKYGCIWYDDGTAKPAYEAIQMELIELIPN